MKKTVFLLSVFMACVAISVAVANEKSDAKDHLLPSYSECADVANKIMDGPDVPAEVSEWGATLTIGAVSQYADDRAGQLWHQKPCLQGDILVNMPFGFYMDIWGSMSSNGKKEGDFGDEIDFTFGWAGPVKDWFDLDVSVALWDICDLFTWGRYDVATAVIDISKTFELSKTHSLTVGGASEYYWEVKGNFEGLGDGWHNWLYVSHNWKVLPWLTFGNCVKVVQDDGYAGADWAIIGHHKVSMTAEITRQYSVEIFARTFTPLTPTHVNELVGPDDLRDTETIFGCSMSIKLF